ncbi:hypothetical protein GH721_08995 [Kriegella sp. EG-1]|nr:hypothetical protein [Flavobacteriaceae bacterium EG-1]
MKIVFYFTLFLFCSQLCFSQSFVGYETDNFNGIHGILVNPGNTAYQKNKAEVNLFSFGGTSTNDFFQQSVFDIFDGNFDITKLNSRASNENIVFENSEVVGPSFVLDLDPKKFSVALFSKLRKISNYNSVNGDLFLSIENNFPNNDFDINQENFHGTTHAWGELGASFGHILVDRLINGNEKHLLKAGVTLKWLRGIGIGIGYSNNITGEYSTDDTQLNLNGDFSYLEKGIQNSGLEDFIKETSGQGVGMDLGFSYEWQTRKSIKEDDRKEDYRALNQYRLKVGVSVLDIGRIDYGNAFLKNYALNGPITNNAFESAANFTDILNDYLVIPSTEGKLKIQLPTRVRAEVDFKIKPFIYANIVHNQSIVKSNTLYNNYVTSSTTLTARYETRKLSAYLPITISQYGTIDLIESNGLDVGLGINIFGFVHIGSGSVISNLITTKNARANTANFYCGLKIPISYNILDK